MAQLSDDCFAFGGPLLPVDEIERLLADRIAPVGETERVSLHEAAGRVLAADLVASVDLPTSSSESSRTPWRTRRPSASRAHSR